MNYLRIVLAAAAGTVTYYVLGFLVFGLLFKNIYQPYETVYRPQNMIMKYMPIGMAGTFIAIAVLTIILASGFRSGAGPGDGARLGILIGIFAACAFVGDNFVTLNIGRRLALCQAGGAILAWTVVGMVTGLVYKPKLP